MIPLTDEAVRSHRTPYVTYFLIAANVFFFFMSSSHDIDVYGLRAGDVVSGTYYLGLLTSMFLHGSLLHLVFNIWSLWIFGDNVEDDLGTIGYLILYFISGIAGGLTFAYFSADPQALAIGASGAIAGVMGAYLVLHPRNHVLTLVPLGFFITTLRINAPIFIGLWFLLQFAGFAAASDTGVAYSAHVGGFIAGVILAFLLRKKPREVEVIQ